ncbi:MAG: hypothetical protein HRU41_08285 [Saprospiraceae bacterium]|nr:hypothetical protein [Saprospiraceae bacterium]
MQKNFFLLLLGCLTVNLAAQNVREFSAAQLQEDFQFLKQSFETYNPALGIFHPKSPFDQRYEELYAELDKPLTDVEFFPYVMQLGAATREGHTFVRSDTVTRVFQGFFQNEFAYLPISVQGASNKVYVWSNFSPDSTLERGAQILSINGKSMEDIVEHLSQFVIADGDIQTYKYEKAVDQFTSYYYWFLEKPKSFDIQYIPHGGKGIKEITLPALVRDSMIAWRDRRYGKPKPVKEDISRVYTFKIEGNTAILDLNTFNRQLKDKYKIKPKKLYKEIFKELRDKGVKHLIMDVRNNTGGRREYAKHLLPYFMKKAYSGPLQKDKSWKGRTTQKKFPKPKKLAFDGQIYVLTNWRTFSNGSIVTIYAKDFGDAIVIGQEPGSRYEGFAAGSTQYVNLPNTKIRVGIPRYLLQSTYPLQQTNLKNRGIIPDHPIEYQIQDYIDKKDRAMEKAKELIRAADQ